MSFYHILPSDAAKDRFPNYRATQYSIPIDDAQQLTGQWEAAIAQLSYSNCLYTFDNETINIGEACVGAYQCDIGCRNGYRIQESRNGQGMITLVFTTF